MGEDIPKGVEGADVDTNTGSTSVESVRSVKRTGLGSSDELESDGDYFEPLESQYMYVYLTQRNEEGRAWSFLERIHEEQAMGIAGRTRGIDRQGMQTGLAQTLVQRGKCAWNALILVRPRGHRREYYRQRGHDYPRGASS